MTRRTTRRFAWLLAAASVPIVALYAANIPFYAGSTVGRRLCWRMEHGRLRIERRPAGSPSESFSIAINSEGLGFAPQWRVYGAGHWLFVVPLWAPLGACALGSAGLFYAARSRARTRASACAGCGYDLRGLASGTKCPECGKG